MEIHSNFWVEKNGQVVLSIWRVELLEAVEETGSITAAAGKQGVPYRVAWQKLNEMEKGLGFNLTERTVGGEHGGGTRLTPEGRELVRKFGAFTAGLQETVEQRFEAVFGSP